MPSVQILSPVAGEKVYVGTTYQIRWTSSGTTNQRIQYSIDGGLNFNPIQTGLAPNIQQFNWSVPGGIVPDGQASIGAIIRIVVRDVNGVEASSGSTVIIANAVVTSIVPSHGPIAGNTPVSVNGNGFAPGCNVKFGNLDGLNIQVIGSTQIQATTPAAAAGPVDVKVKNPGVPGTTVVNGFTYDPPPPPTPMPSGIVPPSGLISGNVPATINGSNFDPQVNVKFGTIDAQITQVLPNSIKVVIPPMATPGLVEVKVKNPAVAGVAVPGGFIYNAPAPMPTGIVPPSGLTTGNLPATINGSNFDPQATVKFGTIDAQITQITANSIKVVIPPMATPGLVEVKVKNPTVPGVAVPGGFTYNALTPMPTGIVPPSALTTGNFPATIGGSNFDPQVNVKFGTIDAQITQVFPNSIKVVIPPMAAPGLVEVKVKNPSVVGVAVPGGFTYNPPPPPPPPATPMPTGIVPPSGLTTGNLPATISGSNFDPQVNVKFGTVDAQITEVTNNTIKVVIPPMTAPGLVEVKVKNPSVVGVAVPGGFTYNPPQPPPPPPATPMPTGIVPPSGLTTGNVPATISGSNFDPQVNVKFGAVDAQITEVLPNSIKVLTPPMTAIGLMEVKVKNPTVLGVAVPGGFTYNAPPPPPPPPVAPMPTGIMPSSGLTTGNLQATISGSNFDPQVNVKFGTIDAQIMQVMPSSIKVLTPPMTAIGLVEVKVKNPTVPGVAVPGGFTYNAPPPPPATPMVTRIEPASGPISGNTQVTISGSNFDPQVNVKFGTIDGVDTAVTNGGTRITTKTPVVGTAGTVDLKVKNPAVSGVTIPGAFTFNGPPTIMRIDPPEGPREGGITVKVLGMNFQPGATVRFADPFVPGTPLVNDQGTIITCTLPPGEKGPVKVTVTNPAPDSQKGSLDGAFSYLGPNQAAAARIFSISPKTVLLETDTLITVKGRNLATAIQQGVFAVRGPNQNFAAIQMRSLSVSTSQSMQEDTVTFFLKFSRPTGLSLAQRVPYYIVASVRPNSRNDHLFEASRKGQFTLVTNSSPVAFGVTGQLIDGAANMILLSGRGLKGSKVSVADNTGKSLPLSYVDDREDLLVVGLMLDAGLVPVGQSMAKVTLLDANSRTVGLPIPLDVMPGPLTDEDTDLPPGRLKTVPGQEVVSMDEPNLSLFVLASSTGGGGWLPGGISFPTSDFSYQPVFDTVENIFIDLVRDSVIVPTFGRSSTKVGVVRPMRAVPLVIHLEITLVVSVRVVVFRQGNPFKDSSIGNFNEFPNEFPDAFGTYLAFISASAAIDVAYLISLVLPDNTFKPLLWRNIDFVLSQDKRMLTIGDVILQAQIISIRPRGGTANLELIAPQPVEPPLKDLASYFGLFFARGDGRECTEWEFNLTFSNRFLDGTPVEDGGDENAVFVVRICSEVAKNPNLHKLVLTSEPPALGDPERLDLDTTEVRNAILHARLVPTDKNENPIGVGEELIPPAVTFRYVPDVPEVQPAITIATDPTGRTSVTAQQLGSGEIQAATTAGPGTALLPSSVFGFLTTNGVTQPLSAMLDTLVSAPSDGVKVRLAFEPVPRAEPFGPALPVEPLLSLMALENIPANFTKDVVVKIERKVTAFLDPMIRALKGPATIPNSPIVQGRIEAKSPNPDLEARFARFFTGQLVDNKTFKVTLPNKMFVGKESIPLPLSLIANRQEIRRPGPGGDLIYDALVPPGGKKTPGIPDTGESSAAQVTIEFKLTSETKGVEFATDAVQATLVVDREEDYEEYFRALTECAAARGTVFDQFLVNFENRLSQSRTQAEIKTDVETTGKQLFNMAVTQVKGQAQDCSDKPLYWARLSGRVLVKQALSADKKLQQDMLELFDRSSRGLPLKFDDTDKIRVIYVGFDPFNLFLKLDRGNPSGLMALFLNGSTALKLSQNDGSQLAVAVRTCVVPARYQDFDAGLIEDAVKDLIPTADMVITSSQGFQKRYDIEQSAGRHRGGSRDNRYEGFPVKELPDSDEFRFTTLPWRGLVSRDDLTKDGSDTTAALLFNQGFAGSREMDQNGQPIIIGHQSVFPGGGVGAFSLPMQADAFLELPNDPDNPPIDSNDISVLQTSLPSISGSAGQFLSNELFYRVAGERDRQGRGIKTDPDKKILPMGHLHLPEFIGTENTALSKLLFKGVGEILRSLLFDIKRAQLTKPVQQFTFEPILKRTSPGKPLTIDISVQNDGDKVFDTVVDLCIATPARGNFDPVGKIPNVKIDKKGKIPVASLMFKGGQRGTYGLGCTLRETENLVPVFRTDVIIKVADPKITGVNPLMGQKDDVITITGEDFVPRFGKGDEMLQVKFGGVSGQIITIEADAKKLTCKVPGGLAAGLVDVTLISPHSTTPIVFQGKFTVRGAATRPIGGLRGPVQ